MEGKDGKPIPRFKEFDKKFTISCVMCTEPAAIVFTVKSDTELTERTVQHELTVTCTGCGATATIGDRP